MYVCIYIYIYIIDIHTHTHYIYTHTHTHTHTYTPTHPFTHLTTFHPSLYFSIPGEFNQYYGKKSLENEIKVMRTKDPDIAVRM